MIEMIDQMAGKGQAIAQAYFAHQEHMVELLGPDRFVDLEKTKLENYKSIGDSIQKVLDEIHKNDEDVEEEVEIPNLNETPNLSTVGKIAVMKLVHLHSQFPEVVEKALDGLAASLEEGLSGEPSESSEPDDA
jgi:hypothetical protein